MATQGRRTNVDTNDVNYEMRAAITVDVRAATDYGLVRGYFRSGVQNVTPGASATAPTIFWDRGYMEFAGFTVGKARSKFDVFGLNSVTYGKPRTSGDTDAYGVTLAAYTYKAPNGFSASVSAEDPGGHFPAGVVDGSQPAFFGLSTITMDNGLSQNAGGSGFQVPDLVANARVDQTWGDFGVSGAAHQVAGGYYLTPDSTTNGHPSSVVGWAFGVGGQLNVPMVGTGDTVGAMFVASNGADGYAGQGQKWLLFNGSREVGAAWGIDGFFDSPVNGVAGTQSPIELTKAFSINAAYDHGWNDKWRTSLYGGFESIRYDSNAVTMINSHLAGVAGSIACGVAVFNSVTTPIGGNPLAGNSCSPNYSFWTVGSRTQYSPNDWLQIGVDVFYTRLSTAFSGPVAAISASGAQPGAVAGPAGPATVADQNVLSGLVRVQLSFLPGS